MSRKRLKSEIYSIIEYSLISTGIIFLILLICSLIFKFYYAIALSFLIASLVGCVLFYFFDYQVSKSTDRMLRQTIRLNFITRTFVYIACMVGLFFIFKRNVWVVVATVCGYLVNKVVIIFIYLKGGKKKQK